MSKDATKMYSTCFSVLYGGYCDLTVFGRRAPTPGKGEAITVEIFGRVAEAIDW
jgi:hypothetical protein